MKIYEHLQNLMVRKMLPNENIDRLPGIKRDAPLRSRLISVTLIGFDKIFKKKGALYFRLLCRLIDKAAKDYLLAKKLIEKEIKSKDKLTYKLLIIDHLEDCLSSVGRISRIINIIEKGKRTEKFSGRCSQCNQKIKKNSVIFDECDFLKFSKLAIYKKVQAKELRDIRNRIEHIDEDIYLNKVNGSIFLNIDDRYQKVSLNGKSCSFFQLVYAIESYHELMLEVISNLPKKRHEDIYYDNNNKEWKRPK